MLRSILEILREVDDFDKFVETMAPNERIRLTIILADIVSSRELNVRNNCIFWFVVWCFFLCERRRMLDVFARSKSPESIRNIESSVSRGMYQRYNAAFTQRYISLFGKCNGENVIN